MVYASVGIKCPECAKLPRSAVVRLKPRRLGLALGAALAGGVVMGVALVYLQSIGLFFALILGWLVGLGMSGLVLAASGRYRGAETARIALGGAVFAYLFPYLLFYGLDVGAVATTLARAPFTLLGLLVAGYIAYTRTQ